MTNARCRLLVSFVIAAALCGTCGRDSEAAKRRFLASGDEYFAQKKYREAAIQFKNALEHDARFAEARLKLADALTQAGDLGAAMSEYVRAADLLPDDVQLQMKTGWYLLLAGRAEDAKAKAEQALRREPGNVDAQVLLGSALAGMKDLDAAIAEIEAAVRLDPTRSTTQTTLGMLQLKRGDRLAAEAALVKATQLDRKSVRARLALASFYWTTRQLDRAEEVLKAALDIDGSDLLANRAAAAFYIWTKRPQLAEKPLQVIAETTKRPEAQLGLADYYAAFGRREEAVKILEALAKQEPFEAPAKTRLAALEHAAGRPDQGQRLLGEVLDTNPKYAPALRVKGELLLQAGNRGEALAALQSAASADPRSARPWLLQGRIHVQAGRLEEARAAFEEALRVAPADGEVLFELGRVDLARGASESALRYARESIAARPDNVAARLLLAKALLTRKEFDQARSELDWLVARQPNLAAVHEQVGLLAGMLNDPVKARAAFERALQLDPHSVEALNGLVVINLSTKNVQRARELVDARLASAATSPPTLLVAARAYAAQGDMAGAEGLLRQALEIDASYLPAYAALGQLYIAQRKLDAARAEYDALAGRAPRPVAALTMAGIILQVQQQMEDAKARYEQALRVDPDAAVAANNLAWIFAEAGSDLDRALQLAQTAKARLPETPEVSDTLGWVYYKKDLPALSLPLFRECIERDARKGIYHLHLALTYWKLGDHDNARVAFEKAVQLQPELRSTADARQLTQVLAASR